VSGCPEFHYSAEVRQPLATSVFERLSDTLGPPVVRWPAAADHASVGMTLTREGWPVVSLIVPLAGGRGDGSCIRHFHPRTENQVEDLAARLAHLACRPDPARGVLTQAGAGTG